MVKEFIESCIKDTITYELPSLISLLPQSKHWQRNAEAFHVYDWFCVSLKLDILEIRNQL